MHTPAPWTVYERVEGDGLLLFGPRSKMPFVIDGPDFAPAAILGDGPANRGEARANARLISAAPALLAAAEHVLAKLNDLNDLDGTCRSALRAAIGATRA